jgi:chromosome partitioning protein
VPMSVLTIANQKGGVGKSLLALHWAWHQAERGRRVLHIDLDSQANSSAIFETYAGPVMAAELFEGPVHSLAPIEAGRILSLPAHGDLGRLERADPAVIKHFVANVGILRGMADNIVIDTAPGFGVRMTAALIAATHVLSPIDLDVFARQGMATLLRTIYGVREKANPGLVFLGMVANRVNPQSQTHKAAFAMLRSDPDLAPRVVPVLLKTRAAYSEALLERKPVWKMSGSSAREAGGELRELFSLLDLKIKA